MNERYLFRGKQKDSDAWLYVDLSEEDTLQYFSEMDKNTIGQYTGLKDKNGKNIWEGDIIRFRCSIDSVIEFQHGAFGFEGVDSFIALAGNPNFTFNPFDMDYDFEIIGNIHDNKELLNEK